MPLMLWLSPYATPGRPRHSSEHYHKFGEIAVYYYVNGTVAHIEPYMAVIDCGGVGYACRTTNHTISKINVGKAVKLYTHLYVREDIFELYGFASESELGCFRMLIGVSGVGPKAALAILSANSPEGLAMAIVSGNEKALTSAPGIGKKIAQRIILELKDKLAKGQLTTGGGEAFAGGVTIIPENKASEASAALAVLGYSQNEIAVALKGVDLETLSLEEVVKQALKKMIKT
jgi:Holliday junction DNA helicase RuvA